ncbi:MAG: exodeoxyribonuclease VII large subunit [Ruminococcaceae bacterium]|nr:exodeoxyribonuclease VII large subunit [Oscillospiraceae bacterium]
MNQMHDSARILTVSNVNNYIKSLLAYDTNLAGVYVSGEISNFKIYNSGHAYFSLKDPGGLLKCVMFANKVQELQFRPQDGMKVLVFGSVSVYERDGVYQLYAQKIVPDGVGALYMAYEALKNKLEAEGLFDNSRKKTIPSMPQSIGVVTSETGAVIRDIQNVINRRFPTMNLKLFHVSVQGENASPEIVRALKYISKTKCCDVVIVGRGGGSIEDLWAFNEEATVRAVAECSVPTISAVGHETDFTLTDFAADLRAPTPSAAAELAVPVLSELQEKVAQFRQKISVLPRTNCKIKQIELDKIKQSRIFTQPLFRVENELANINMSEIRLNDIVSQEMTSCEKHIKMLNDHLQALNPISVLKRGYSIVYKEDGKAVTDASAIKSGEKIDIQTADGRFAAQKL